MISYRDLSRPLRLAVAAPWCLCVALAATAATPAFRQLLVDPSTNEPTATLSLSGANWTGTLDAARLPTDPLAGKDTAPASVNALGGILAGDYATRSGSLLVNDAGIYVYGYQIADENGCLLASNYVDAPGVYSQEFGFYPGGRLSINDDGSLVFTDGHGHPHILATRL